MQTSCKNERKQNVLLINVCKLRPPFFFLPYCSKYDLVAFSIDFYSTRNDRLKAI